MNSKIKSRKIIELEIDDLFIDFKSGNALAKRINLYLNNLSGKEIISYREIQSIIFDKILSIVKNSDNNFIITKELIKIFPYLDYINKDIDAFRTSALHKNDNSNNDDIFFDVPSHYRIPFNIMNLFNERFYFMDTMMITSGYLENLFSINGRINDLFVFLKNNNDISDLLQEYFFISKKELIKNMVVQKIIPLNSIFVFFDIDKSVKENTNELYLLLNRKFPKNTIQAAIHDNLDKIRKGIFSVPGL